MQKTIQVSPSTHEEMKKMAKKHGITMGDLTWYFLEYFKKTGLDPRDMNSIQSLISQQSKRLNQIIAFIKTQEREHLIPLVERLNDLIEEIEEKESTGSGGDGKEILKSIMLDVSEIKSSLNRKI